MKPAIVRAFGQPLAIGRVPAPTPGSEHASVLFTTSELADFVKVGGLGDVSAALPRALRRHGIDVRVLIPGYREVIAQSPIIRVVGGLPALNHVPACRLGRLTTADGLVVYVLLCPELYEREGTPYGDALGADWPDNDLRFARLGLAAAAIAQGAADPGWRADLLHLNDWPAALAAGYLAWSGKPAPPSVLTIHNLAYQGLFPPERAAGLGIPEDALRMDGVEFHGRLSFLKAGLVYASHLTTVSPNYAREIVTPEFGCGLDGLLRSRAAEGRLTGILNGVDESWDPRTDPHLLAGFGVSVRRGKQANADHVRTAFGLGDSTGPLFAIVSRLVHQKGVDLAVAAAAEIVAQGGQIVVTGRGEPALEDAVRSLAARHPGSIGVRVGYEETEARRIHAASDFLLMPSRFEPCGLSQMHAQRFGSLPIAHSTGGLVDTIEDGVTGFLFQDLSFEGLLAATRRAFAAFASPSRFEAMRNAAMARPLGWTDAARSYAGLFEQLQPGLRRAWRQREALPGIGQTVSTETARRRAS